VQLGPKLVDCNAIKGVNISLYGALTIQSLQSTRSSYRPIQKNTGPDGVPHRVPHARQDAAVRDELEQLGCNARCRDLELRSVPISRDVRMKPR